MNSEWLVVSSAAVPWGRRTMLRGVGAGRLLVGCRFQAPAVVPLSARLCTSTTANQPSAAKRGDQAHPLGPNALQRRMPGKGHAAKGGTQHQKTTARSSSKKRPQSGNGGHQHSSGHNQHVRKASRPSHTASDPHRPRQHHRQHAQHGKRKRDGTEKDRKEASAPQHTQKSTQKSNQQSEGAVHSKDQRSTTPPRPTIEIPPVTENPQQLRAAIKLQPVFAAKPLNFTRVGRYYAWKEAKAAPRTSPGADWWKPEKPSRQAALPRTASTSDTSMETTESGRNDQNSHANGSQGGVGEGEGKAEVTAKEREIKNGDGQCSKVAEAQRTAEEKPALSSMLPEEVAEEMSRDEEKKKAAGEERKNSPQAKKRSSKVQRKAGAERKEGGDAKAQKEPPAEKAAEAKRLKEEERVLQMKDWTPTQVLTELKAVGVEPSSTIYRRLLAGSSSPEATKSLLVAILKQSQTQASRKTIPVCATLLKEVSEAMLVAPIPGAIDRVARLTYSVRKRVKLSPDDLLAAIKAATEIEDRQSSQAAARSVLKVVNAVGKKMPRVCVAAGDACAKFDPALSWSFYCRAASCGGLERMPFGFPQLLNNCIMRRDFELASRVHTAMALMPVSTKFDRRHLVNTYLCMERTDLAASLLEDMPKEFLEKQWFFDFAKLYRTLGPKTKMDLQPVLDALTAKGVGIDSISGLRMTLLKSAVSNDFSAVLQTVRETIDSGHPHASTGLAFVSWLPVGVMRAEHVKRLLRMALEVGSFSHQSDGLSGPSAIRRSLWVLLKRKRYHNAVEILDLLCEVEKKKFPGVDSRSFNLSILFENIDWSAGDSDNLARAAIGLASMWSSPQERQVQLYELWASGLVKAGAGNRCGSLLESASRDGCKLQPDLEQKLRKCSEHPEEKGSTADGRQ